jgi:hypothetical protein
MDSITTSVWRQRGSCVVFDRQALSPLLAAAGVISLRQALAWTEKPLPDEPPTKTILIFGLETTLQILPPSRAYNFLLYRVRPLLRKLQQVWPACGLVLAFTAPEAAFVEDSMNDEVFYKRSDQQRVRLSEGLWDGGAAVNLKRIVRETEQGREEKLGYHVARIS